MCPCPGSAPFTSLFPICEMELRLLQPGSCRETAHVASPGPRGRREDGRSEVSVPHWSGPQTARTCTLTSAPQPQSLFAEPTPEAMKLSLPLLLLLGAWAVPGGLGDRTSLSATAPQLDDEEKYSVHMPAHMRCDAYRAVAYQVSPSLRSPTALVTLHLPHIPPLVFDPQPPPRSIKPQSQPSTLLISPPHLNCHASVYSSVCPTEGTQSRTLPKNLEATGNHSLVLFRFFPVCTSSGLDSL
jgi:hypothetical protein